MWEIHIDIRGVELESMVCYQYICYLGKLETKVPSLDTIYVQLGLTMDFFVTL
jgi:hypothetical protein